MSPWSGPVSRRRLLGLGVSAVMLLAVGCGGGGESQEKQQAGSPSAPVSAFTIVALDNRWDLDRVVVPVAREVSARIENSDAGVAHNLHIRLPDDPKTEVVVGVATQELRFVVRQPGEYEFLCDVHPFMTGVVVAVASPR